MMASEDNNRQKTGATPAPVGAHGGEPAPAPRMGSGDAPGTSVTANKSESGGVVGKILSAVAILAGLALAGFIAWGLWLASHPPKEPIEGQIDATVIDVASKIAGRIKVLNVLEGDKVALGDQIAIMDIPEIAAKLRQAKAVAEARQAKASLAHEGARRQEIEAARAQWQRASAEAELAEKTYRRMENLHKDGFVPTQRLDEATAKLRATKMMERAAAEQLDIAVTGARTQDKEAADAMAEQAAGSVEEVESYASEAVVRAPMNGEVSRVLLRAGEVAPQGFPIVTLVDTTDQWAVFNIREDDLPGLTIGTVVRIKIPALGGPARDFKVYFMSPRGDYATWRSTRAQSGFDLKTFEVRARPLEAIKEMRPGMTALIERN